ncbi:4-hydroxy-tetrahydrodipicolinate synthase [Actinomycetaceae bacterium MB13-C1-2]|nr:4-hydroxy-tetrahydrodipicolinate synthase [Actinomycetaceae bacterium MB13-C1-2]
MVFQGSAPALVTPFRDGKIDFDSLERLVDFQLDGGSDAIAVCGTTGEPSTMTLKEEVEVAKAVSQQVNGRIPIIAGIGGNATQEVLDATELMSETGVDALLGVTPYYNKTTQGGLVAHYTAVANATDLPVILYNVPARTGLNMLPATIAELAEVPNIVAVKEACGNITQIMELFRLCLGKIQIFSGNDDHVFPLVAMGGDGVISVVANAMPRYMHDMVATTMTGDLGTGRKMQLDMLPLVDLLFCEVSPIPIKAALSRMGMLDNELRLPLVPMTDENEAKLFTEMERIGLV